MSRTFLKSQGNALFLSILLILFYSFFLIPSGALNQFRLASLDNLHRLKYRYFNPSQTEKIVIVAIDDYSLKAAEEKWPWPRRRLASLIDKISAAHPRAIVLDLLLIGESDEENDLLLAQSIKNAGNVFLPFYIQKGKLVRPLQIFAQAAKGNGFVNKLRDRDFKVRNNQLSIVQGNKIYYPLDLYAAADYLNIPFGKIALKPRELIFGKNIIPVGKDRILPISYSAKYSDFKTIPIIEILKSDTPPKELKEKIVLVGRVSEAFHDVYQTPLGIMPGIAINANNILMFINRDFGRYVSSPLTFLAFLLVGMLSSLSTFRLGFLKGLLTIAFIITVVFILSFFLFLKGYYLDFFSILFLCFSVYILTNFYKYFHLLVSGERLKRLAITDEVTGVFTGRYFSFRLQAEIAQKKKLSLVSISIDNLKDISSDQQNNLLRKVALVLRKQSPPKAIIAKSSWERFAILFENKNREYLSNWVAKVKSAIEALELPEEKIKPLISIKISAPKGLKEDKEGVRDDLEYLAIDLKERNKELLALLDELRKSQRETEQAYLTAIQSLITALEEKDPYTAGHSQRVCKYSLMLADKLNLPSQTKDLIRQGALLHDLGKIGLPDRILHKKGKLTPEELKAIKKHPADGARILQPIKPFKKYIPILLYHHEREDGKGYQGIKGESLPIEAKIVAIADAFDAMTSGREYRKAMSVSEAIEELRKNAGGQFKREYVEKFVEAIKENSNDYR